MFLYRFDALITGSVDYKGVMYVMSNLLSFCIVESLPFASVVNVKTYNQICPHNHNGVIIEHGL